MKKIIMILFFLGFQAQAEKKYLICDFLKEGARPANSFDGKQNWFDTVINYERDSQGSWKGSLGNGIHSLGLRFKSNVLSEAFLDQVSKPQNFYRESFDLYRFNLDSQILTQSRVYYVSKEDFNKNFNEPLFTSQNKASLFELIPKEAPKGYVKIGWDQHRWKCHKISLWRYWYFAFGLGLLF